MLHVVGQIESKRGSALGEAVDPQVDVHPLRLVQTQQREGVPSRFHSHPVVIARPDRHPSKRNVLYRAAELRPVENGGLADPQCVAATVQMDFHITRIARRGTACHGESFGPDREMRREELAGRGPNVLARPLIRRNLSQLFSPDVNGKAPATGVRSHHGVEHDGPAGAKIVVHLRGANLVLPLLGDYVHVPFEIDAADRFGFEPPR